MTDTRPSPLSLTSLQVAWLAELGIEKPWLPATSPTVVEPVFAPRPASVTAPVPLSAVPARPSRVVPAAVTTKVVIQAAQSPEQLAALSDMTTLSAAVRACQACGLCTARQQAVMGEGVTQPAIMVVGEAPGQPAPSAQVRRM